MKFMKNPDENFNVEVVKENFSFDTECKNIKNSKKLRKNILEVFDLGEKIDNFVYPAEPLLHRNSQDGQPSGTILFLQN